MAIMLDLSWRGVVVPNAYVRVDRITGGKREFSPNPQVPGQSVWVGVFGIYANPSESVPLWAVEVIIPFDTEESPFPGLYAALKESPDFSNGVDC